MLSTLITNNQTVGLFHLVFCPASKSSLRNFCDFPVVHYEIELWWLAVDLEVLWAFSFVTKTREFLLGKQRQIVMIYIIFCVGVVNHGFPLMWLISGWKPEARSLLPMSVLCKGHLVSSLPKPGCISKNVILPLCTCKVGNCMQSTICIYGNIHFCRCPLASHLGNGLKNWQQSLSIELRYFFGNWGSA